MNSNRMGKLEDARLRLSSRSTQAPEGTIIMFRKEHDLVVLVLRLSKVPLFFN